MKARLLIWLILLLTLLAVYVDLPSKLPPLKFQIASLKVDQGLVRPPLSLGGFYRDLEIKEGLDLAGGTHLVLEADMSSINSSDRNSALESLQGIIERRVNLFGVSEPIIQTAKVGDSYRVIVELAGITDVSEAVSLVGQTASLVFREESATASGAIATESAYGPFTVSTTLTGKDLQKATPAFDPSTGEPIVQLQFTSEGGRQFEELTRKNLGKQLAIFLDDELLMAPVVQSVITGGQGVISGNFTAAQTKQLAILLNSGALPAPVKIIEQRTIGATLGEDSIKRSLAAGVVGLVIVALFMLGNYRRFGLYANLALIVYTLLVLAIFKLIPVTLTLAGIAGFILSIGMAVDANILIFERMREELRWGRGKLAAIEAGFSRAFPSIRDSNVSSLITCTILYWFGTGPVRGFAVTLAIGILVSLFTAITVTRTFLRLFEAKVEQNA